MKKLIFNMLIVMLLFITTAFSEESASSKKAAGTIPYQKRSASELASSPRKFSLSGPTAMPVVIKADTNTDTESPATDNSDAIQDVIDDVIGSADTVTDEPELTISEKELQILKRERQVLAKLEDNFMALLEKKAPEIATELSQVRDSNPVEFRATVIFLSKFKSLIDQESTVSQSGNNSKNNNHKAKGNSSSADSKQEKQNTWQTQLQEYLNLMPQTIDYQDALATAQRTLAALPSSTSNSSKPLLLQETADGKLVTYSSKSDAADSDANDSPQTKEKKQPRTAAMIRIEKEKNIIGLPEDPNSWQVLTSEAVELP